MSGLLDLFDPNVRRLGLLPYPQGSLSGQKGPVEWSNWVAPQLAVDMAKAIDLPGRAWRGEQISPDDVTKMAMDTMGGSGLLSRAIPTGDVGGLLGINVFHGGPHRWSPEPGFPEGRPRLDKMGTGQGVQAYGHGIYKAEAPDVAKSYTPRDMDAEDAIMQRYKQAEAAGDYEAMSIWENALLHETPSEIRARYADPDYDEMTRATANRVADELETIPMSSAFYKLDIPDADVAKYLDWDAPLSEQPKSVAALFEATKLPPSEKARITRRLKEIRKEELLPNSDLTTLGIERDRLLKIRKDAKTGQEFYNQVAVDLGSEKAASEALAKAGIPGLKYFDQGSRGTREGTRNYVTWDQDVLDRTKILERDGKPK